MAGAAPDRSFKDYYQATGALVKHTDSPESAPYFTLARWEILLRHMPQLAYSDKNAKLLIEVSGGLKAELAAYP
ncbi:MAG: hypothetical protein AB8B63_23415 [Granulosicoccus sp.]